MYNEKINDGKNMFADAIGYMLNGIEESVKDITEHGKKKIKLKGLGVGNYNSLIYDKDDDAIYLHDGKQYMDVGDTSGNDLLELSVILSDDYFELEDIEMN